MSLFVYDTFVLELLKVIYRETASIFSEVLTGVQLSLLTVQDGDSLQQFALVGT